VVTAKLCTLAELNAWAYTWDEIWQMHDMLDLSDWIDWHQHQKAAQS
jgi:hypothetical protein